MSELPVKRQGRVRFAGSRDIWCFAFKVQRFRGWTFRTFFFSHAERSCWSI